MLNTIYIPSVNQDIPEQTNQDIDIFFEQLENANISQLVIYFHGGLTNRTKAESIALDRKDQFQQSGRHVVSLIWETGVLETIKSRVNQALDKPLFRKIFPVLESVVAKHLKISKTTTGAKGGFNVSTEKASPTFLTEEDIIALSRTLEDEFQKKLSIDSSLDSEIIKEFQNNPELSDSFYIDAVSNPNDFEEGAKSFNILGVVPNPARMLSRIAISVLKRYTNQTHHDLRETIIEEILREIYAGAFIKALWEDMKIRAKDMWEKEPADANGLARYFLEKLSSHQVKNPEFRIDLIGHSAGSIVICNMLATSARFYKNLIFGTIIFLAPAATMEFFYDEIVTKPERYRQFYMFTMTDEQEKSDILVEIAGLSIYGYSLLYLVCGLLEPLVDQPICGMMRYLTDVPPFDTHKLRRINDFLIAEEERLILSPGKPTRLGLQTESKSHGGFSDDKMTVASIRSLLDRPLLL
jgi:hypothetical protein